MKAYHFLPIEYALQDIKYEWIKVSRIYDLNDPFELMGTDMRDKSYRKLFRDFKNKIDARYGIICFSKAWVNPLLWSHYANKHKGVCFGFDIPEKLIKEVSYSGKRLPEKFRTKLSKDFSENGVNEFLTIKFKDWEYEDEIRLIVPLNETEKQDNLYFKKFDDNLILREVIFGSRCNPSTRAELIKQTIKYGYAFEIIIARLAFRYVSMK